MSKNNVAPTSTQQTTGVSDASGSRSRRWHESASSIEAQDRREAEATVGMEKDPCEMLAWAWANAPIADNTAYVEVFIQCIQIGAGLTSVDEIDSGLRYEDLLPPRTKIPALPEALAIDHEVDQVAPSKWIPKRTTITLGPLGEALAGHIGTADPKSVADATEWLVKTGDVSRIAEALAYCIEATAHTEDTAAENRRTGAFSSSRRAAKGAPRGIGVKCFGSGHLFATPPMPRLSAYRGRFSVDIGAVLPPVPHGILRTPRGNARPDTRPLAALDMSKELELLDRSPLGSVPREAFSQEAYDEITEWRPIVEEAEPLAAVLQLILTSDLRDEDADIDQPCTGIPLWHELIAAAFGFTCRQHAREEMGVNTMQLIQLYRKYVDSDFHVSKYDPKTGRARILLAHSIPPFIIQTVEETMLTHNPNKDIRLIGGERVKTRGNYDAKLYKRRVKDVEENDPEIPIPEYVQKMQEYLNDYRTEDFSNGQWGFLQSLDKAFEAAHTTPDAKKRRQLIRTLRRIEDHPQPLYKGADFFPRLAAERYNQLMNLPSKVLRAVYVLGRDAEVDLSKAHLACMAPVAEKNGIEAGLLREYLNRNLDEDNFDLWMDVASYFDIEDMAAGRKAAKKLYSVPYGSSENNMVREMRNAYEKNADMQGEWEKVKPVLKHPLVGELFRIREGLKEVIEDRGYLVDAAGRKIQAGMMTHREEGAWKSVLAYTNASFEQKLMWPIFREATEEKAWASEKSHRRPKFRIWVYQSDGVTVRIGSKASNDKQITRLQEAVSEKAEELDIPTKLEVDYTATHS